MENIFQTIINYIWFLIKLVGISLLFSIPFFIIIKLLEKKYLKLRKKLSVIFSLSIIIFIINYIILLFIYFIPALSSINIIMSTMDVILLIIFHVFRLLIINILITAIFLIFALITLAFYDKLNNKYKKRNNLNLIASLTLTNIILFIILLIFPKLMAILIYLIYF
jgi:hypothetical protein